MFSDPVRGTITSSFGNRVNPVTKQREFHTGIDIAVNAGTKVAAIGDGVVTDVGRTDAEGIYIRYTMSGGYEAVFCHLQKALVKKGERIAAGQTVALSGNTGRTTGPHLHYTLLQNGGYVNPMEYVDLPYNADVKAEYAARGETLAEGIR